MAVTPLKLQFEDDDSNILEVSMPVYPIETYIDLPFEIVKLDDNQYSIFDNGSTYDKRYCVCNLEIPLSEASNFNAFFGTNTGLKGRAYDLTMRMNSLSGFFPFGADKGDVGDFNVVATILEPLSMSDDPFKYHKCKIRIDNIGSWPAYSIPSDTHYGKITIGTVSNLYFPKTFFNVNSNYEYSIVLTESSSVNFIDRGTQADSYENSFTLTCHRSQIADLLNYLTVTSRSGTFTITTGNSDYIFGVDKSPTATYACKLTDNKLTIINSYNDIFEINLKLSLVSIS